MGYLVKNRYIQSGSSGYVVPGGTTSQRISDPVDGYIRFNTSSQQLEDWNGLAWEPIGANAITSITNETITPTANTSTYFLNQATTANAAYLTLNGVAQTPNVDYTVSGQYLTFTTAPLTTDIAQLRFLAGNESAISIIANQTITPDGINSSYTMLQSSSAPALLVTINGVLQTPGTYLTNGTTLTFSTVPLVTDIIQVRYIGSANPNSLNIISQSIIADGVSTTYYLNSITNATAIIVSENGITQTPNVDYTVNGFAITFTTVPAAGQNIQVRVIGSTNTYGLIYNTMGSGYVQVTTDPAVILNANGVNSLVATGTNVNVATQLNVQGNINSSSSLNLTGNVSISMNVGGRGVLSVTQTDIVDISGSQSLNLPIYTTANVHLLGNLTPGQVVYVSDGNSGSPCLAVYDGTNWRVVSFGASI